MSLIPRLPPAAYTSAHRASTKAYWVMANTELRSPRKSRGEADQQQADAEPGCRVTSAAVIARARSQSR